MIRLTGTLLFSFIFLLPLKAESAASKEKGTCPTGTVQCSQCGACAPDEASCKNACLHLNKIIPLKKKKDTVYSLEEGAVAKCESGKTLTPTTVGTETYWTCGTSPGTSGKK